MENISYMTETTLADDLKAYVGVQFHKRKKFRLATDSTRW